MSLELSFEDQAMIRCRQKYGGLHFTTESRITNRNYLEGVFWGPPLLFGASRIFANVSFIEYSVYVWIWTNDLLKRVERNKILDDAEPHKLMLTLWLATDSDTDQIQMWQWKHVKGVAQKCKKYCSNRSKFMWNGKLCWSFLCIVHTKM